MNRARYFLATTLAGVLVAGVGAMAQSTQSAPAPAPAAAPAAAVPAPKLTPILSGKKFTPPVRGSAEIDFLQPKTKRDKDIVTTTIEVKNTSNAPIARLAIDETWYDKAGGTVAGGKGTINGLLAPGEIQTITIETPYNKAMAANNWSFAHANGSVKPRKVDCFEGDCKAAAAAAAKPAPKPGAKPRT
jgi:hypothetical protein